MKIKVYGLNFVGLGASYTTFLYFKTKEEREQYIENRLRPIGIGWERMRAKRIEESELVPALADTWDENSVIPGAYDLYEPEV